MLSVASAHIALPVNRLRYAWHSAGSAQGAASRRCPCTPGLGPARMVNKLTAGRTDRRPGKASAATRQKISARSQCLCGGIFYARLAKLTNKLAKANKRPGAAGW